MSEKVKNVLHYILNNYPYPSDLTKTRITKMVYLVDWRFSLKNELQLTDIKWYFDHYGPYVSDVLDVADDDSEIAIKSSNSAFGTLKYIIEKKDASRDLNVSLLTNNEKATIDKVIEETKNLTWNEFIDYVYSSYPIKSQKKYVHLDLIALSKACKKAGLEY